MITPGIFSEFAKLEQARQEREQFRILVFGSGNLEDTELKGYDIAAEAVASLKDESYLLQFVGAPKGKEEEVINRLLMCGISCTQWISPSCLHERKVLASPLSKHFQLAFLFWWVTIRDSEKLFVL